MTEIDLPKGFRILQDRGVRWLEAGIGPRRIVFSLRNRDRSGPTGEAADLDIGRTTERPDSGNLEARRRLCEAVGVDPSSVRIARQVHGDHILELDRPEGGMAGRFLDTEPPAVEADGFLLQNASEPGVNPAIVTADCLPVVIEGPEGISLLHLGWRGLASRLLEDAVARTEGLSAVIGPGIGSCCYEVDPEVFGRLGLREPAERSHLDLAAVAAERLSRSGVTRILGSGLCTRCEEDLLFSHRRDGEKAGRQATIVA